MCCSNLITQPISVVCDAIVTEHFTPLLIYLKAALSSELPENPQPHISSNWKKNPMTFLPSPKPGDQSGHCFRADHHINTYQAAFPAVSLLGHYLRCVFYLLCVFCVYYPLSWFALLPPWITWRIVTTGRKGWPTATLLLHLFLQYQLSQTRVELQMAIKKDISIE